MAGSRGSILNFAGSFGRSLQVNRVLPGNDDVECAAANEDVMEKDVLLTAKICAQMLEISSSMIHTLQRVREDTGFPLHARIGVSVGDAVSGMNGMLQPHFTIQGPVMQHTTLLEESGEIDAVICCPYLALGFRLDAYAMLWSTLTCKATQVHCSADFVEALKAHTPDAVLFSNWSFQHRPPASVICGILS